MAQEEPERMLYEQNRNKIKADNILNEDGEGDTGRPQNNDQANKGIG